MGINGSFENIADEPKNVKLSFLPLIEIRHLDSRYVEGDFRLNVLYFGDEVPERIDMEVSDRVGDTGLAVPIPIYVRFQARGHPIVGTTMRTKARRILIGILGI